MGLPVHHKYYIPTGLVLRLTWTSPLTHRAQKSGFNISYSETAFKEYMPNFYQNQLNVCTAALLFQIPTHCLLS
jgi:hypothetical protein